MRLGQSAPPPLRYTAGCLRPAHNTTIGPWGKSPLQHKLFSPPHSLPLLLDRSHSVGSRERQSALPLSFPGRWRTWNLKGCNAMLHLESFALFSLSRSSHSSARWSVWIMKGLPSRYTLNACVANLMARHSFSMVAYFCSLASSFLL